MPSGANAAGTNPSTSASRRWISPPLAAQTLSGTVKGQQRCWEVNATNNLTLAFTLLVIKPDGTLRGNLLASIVASDDTVNTPPEAAVGSGNPTNRRFLTSAEVASITLSSLAVSAGDRIVVELGGRSASTDTQGLQLPLCAQDALGDLPEDDTTTTLLNNWIEFSANISWQTVRDDPYILSTKNTPTADGTGTNATATITLVPTTGLAQGDLVTVLCQSRSAATWSVGVTGGQTWTEEVFPTAPGTSLFWCTFDGTWDANPRFDSTSSTCTTAVMQTFRGLSTATVWQIDTPLAVSSFAAPSTPFNVTRAGITTTLDDTIAIAGVLTALNNHWVELRPSTHNGWSSLGYSSYRNTSGSQQSASMAGQVVPTAGTATGNAVFQQNTVTGTAGQSWIIAFSATPYREGDGSAGGTGTASGAGGAIKPIVGGNAAGLGAATGAATAIKPTVGGNAAGLGTATAEGTVIAIGVGSSSGLGDATAVAGASSASGDGSATGLGGATAAAETIAAGAGTSNGLGGATAQAIKFGGGAGAAAGTSTVTATATAYFPAVGSSAGLATVTGVSAGTTGSVGNAAGTSSVTAVGAAIAVSVGASAGLGAATAGASTIYACAGSASGSGSVIGISQPGSIGASDGQGAAAAFSAIIRWGAGVSNGIATVTAQGTVLAIAVGGNAGGLGAATAIGRSTFTAVGNAAGTSSANGVNSPFGQGAGSSSGSSVVQGFATMVSAGAGTATGLGGQTAVGIRTAASAGSSAGLASVTGVGSTVRNSVGNAAGSSTVTGQSSTGTGSAGLAAGLGAANANATAIRLIVGNASGAGIASGFLTSPGASVGLAQGLALVDGVGGSRVARRGMSSAFGQAHAQAVLLTGGRIPTQGRPGGRADTGGRDNSAPSAQRTNVQTSARELLRRTG